MAASFAIKRGASLALIAAFTNPDGSITNLTGVTMSASVRDAEFNLVATLTPVATSTPGQASITVADTSSWPEGWLRIDMLATGAGWQVLSPTYGIFVGRPMSELLPAQPDYNPVTG
ncbi:MAG: hypothetical protein B7W99_01890 [Rhodospirillales bacterium 20-58-10]|nr:MAG: hypothetical protein B7W99_01890 [Rhodospirillales bacterium 20-58-10]